jgi:hypothetical protein
VITFVLGLFRGVWLRLVAIAAAGAALLSLYYSVKRSGRRELETEQLRTALDAATKRKETESLVRSLPPSAVDDRLRGDFRD